MELRKKKTKAFVITRDHSEVTGIAAIDDYRLATLDRKEVNLLKKEGYTDHFKLYDDDGVLYYSGYLNPDYDDDENDTEFLPLEWAMYDSGCTEIKYRNKITGEYEIL